MASLFTTFTYPYIITLLIYSITIRIACLAREIVISGNWVFIIAKSHALERFITFKFHWPAFD
jgi:hypothetical protein